MQGKEHKTMMIVDDKATEKLLQFVKTLPVLEGRYCIRFMPDGQQTPQEIRSQFIVFPEADDQPLHVFFCEDGEMFVMMQADSLRDCRQQLTKMCDLLGRAADERFIRIYDLGLRPGELTGLLEAWLEEMRLVKEAKQRAVQERDTQQRRQNILEREARMYLPAVMARSDGRNVPEVMMIEDDAFSSRLVENVLRGYCRLTRLPSALGALEMYGRLAPDLLFLDINLPDVTGHELLERITGMDPHCKVIMLSGNADKQNIMQAMQLGARGFVAKPFTKEKLLQHLKHSTAGVQEATV
jgi:two-component system chemotaxis response regulator CheY